MLKSTVGACEMMALKQYAYQDYYVRLPSECPSLYDFQNLHDSRQ